MAWCEANAVDYVLGFASNERLLALSLNARVLVIEALWNRLGIGEILREKLRKKRRAPEYERALLAMTANRLCEPESKLGVWDRWLSKVYLPSCQGLLLRQMYEAMDFLYAEAREVEEAVFFRTADLLNLDVDLVFYDTTTASFSVDEEDEESEELGSGLRQWGKPKEGGWAVQVVVALAVTREGLPVRCWVFPGKTTDVTTVEQIKADLRGWKLSRALFVADAGMNSKENRAELGRACGKYLLATRLASVAEIKQKVLSAPGRFKVIQENLHAKEVLVGDGERRRRYVLCYNPKEAERQQHLRAQRIEELEAELARHPDKDANAQWAIELLASGRYKRYLTTTAKGRIRIDRAAIREAQRYDGKWVGPDRLSRKRRGQPRLHGIRLPDPRQLEPRAPRRRQGRASGQRGESAFRGHLPVRRAGRSPHPV